MEIILLFIATSFVAASFIAGVNVGISKENQYFKVPVKVWVMSAVATTIQGAYWTMLPLIKSVENLSLVGSVAWLIFFTMFFLSSAFVLFPLGVWVGIHYRINQS